MNPRSILQIGVVAGLWVLSSISLAAEDTWAYKADMPSARVFAGGCVLDGKIYVIGGAPSASSLTSAVEMYDPFADTWTRMANMPSARCYSATCTFDGKIYVFGGTTGLYSSAKKNVYVYDPQADTWAQKADMPYANAGHGIAVIDGTIYLIGGTLSESSPPVSRVMAYNPIRESWAQMADMPTARTFLSACVLHGKIYAIGGAEDWRVSSYKHVEVYNPSTNTWTRKSDMPTQRFSLGTCVVDGKIFAIGGNLALGAARTTNEVYDPFADTWATNSPMQQKRYGLYVGSVGGRIYAIGGSVPGMLSTVEEYDTGLGVPSPDLNGDFVIDIADLIILIEHWGQNDPTFDLAPPPFGDGLVDALDLELIMSYWQQVLDDPTLTAHWKFDETEGAIAYDSAGLNDATVVGVPVWQPAGGAVDGALAFDGTTFIAADFVLNPSDEFSVFASIKGAIPGQVIISQEDGVDWLLTDAQGCLMTQIKSGGRRSDPLYSDVLITDNNWHRVGFTWDGTNRILYVDDVEVAHDTQAGLKASDGRLYIGAGKDFEPGTIWSGLIDDVRVYSRALRP